VRRVENIGDDVPLLVDGVQFDAAIVTVSDQILLLLLFILSSIIIIVFRYSTPVRRVENVGDDVSLLVDGVQFDAVIVSAKYYCYYYYYVFSSSIIIIVFCYSTPVAARGERERRFVSTGGRRSVRRRHRHSE